MEHGGGRGFGARSARGVARLWLVLVFPSVEAPVGALLGRALASPLVRGAAPAVGALLAQPWLQPRAVAAQAAPTLIADSVNEHSGTQGLNNWYYGYYVSPFTSDTFQQMTSFSGNTWYVNSIYYWTELRSDGGHPNGPTTLSVKRTTEHHAVRRWASEVAGDITIAGELRKASANCGDGIVGSIRVNGTEVWSSVIAAGDTTGLTYATAASVNVGSLVDFIIAPRGSDTCDATTFTARITALAPEPGSPNAGFNLHPNASTSLDPVNTFNGDFLYSRTDLAIAGQGPVPTLARSYQSSETRASVLGPAWSVTQYARVRSTGDGTGDRLLITPAGRVDRYVRQPDGSYSPPAAIRTTLALDGPTGAYVATHPDQSRWVFSLTGNLTAMRDRNGYETRLTYNSSNQVVAISDPNNRGSLTLRYDTYSDASACFAGRLCEVTDWLQRRVVFGYDASGRLVSVKDRAGNITTYAYEGTSARLTSITDANGRVAVTNQYDATGRVQYQWDATVVNPDPATLATNDRITRFDYVSNPDGTRATTVTYPATSADPTHRLSQQDTYSAQGWIIGKIVTPAANEAATVSSVYDGSGFLTSATDARGNVTSFCYDTDDILGTPIAASRGNLTRRIDPGPGGADLQPLVTLFRYDARNNLTRTIPPRGVTLNAGVTSVGCADSLAGGAGSAGAVDLGHATTLTYDAAGTNLLSTTRTFTDPELGPQTATSSFAYSDPANPGLVTSVTSPLGHATAFTYFNATTGPTRMGLLASVADPLGNTTTYDYDLVGRRTSTVDPLGNATGGVPAEHTWSATYDTEDRLTASTSPAPVAGGAALVSTSSYDAVGNRTVAVDASGQVTKYLYEARDSLAEVQQSPSTWTDPALSPADLVRTTYAYDNLGNLSRVTRATGDSANERATDYQYDGLNRVRTETQYPSWPSTTGSLVTRSTYDLNGNRATLVDPLGQTTSFAYDALNRATGIDYSDPGTADVSYGYDRGGNRASMTDGTGSTTYAYDELNRALSVTAPGAPTAKTVGYRYDLDGNRTRLIYPDGTAVNYAFDAAGQVQNLTDWAGRATSYQYAPDGALQQATNPNGTRADYASDNARRLSQVWQRQGPNGANTISRQTYTLDALGNRTRVHEVLAPVALPQPLALGVPGDVFASSGSGPAQPDAGFPSVDTAAAAYASRADPIGADVGEGRQVAAQFSGPLPTSTPTPLAGATPTSTATGTVVPTPSPTSTLAGRTTGVTGSPTATASVGLTVSGTLTPTPSPAGTTVATATPSPTLGPPPASTPVAAAGLAALPLEDVRAESGSPYEYRADSPRGYRVELFDKTSIAPGARLTHTASGASLRFELPGVASTHGAAGARATARVGSTRVEWTSYEDRLKEDLVLSSRPVGDVITFLVQSDGLSFVADGEGGYLATGPDGATLFRIERPTVQDALGRPGTATLALSGTSATVTLDPGFLATATYPVTVDPTVIFTSSSGTATGYNNSQRLVQDRYGKLLLLTCCGASNTLLPRWSNDGGQTWSTGSGGPTGSVPTWVLSADQTGLEMAAQQGTAAIVYGRWTIERDASNNITNVTPPASLVTLASADASSPTLVLDRNGLPAVAWVYSKNGPKRWEVRFLRATADPSLPSSWVNARGTSTTPDALGSRSNRGQGSVSLARMPAVAAGGIPTANDDALYLFWSETIGGQLRWSRAQPSGSSYTAWSAPVDKVAAVGGAGNLATAPDSRNQGLVVAYAPSSTQTYVFRKQASNDANAADVSLLAAASPVLGSQVSLGVDRGDVYAFGRNGAGNLVVTRWLGGSWDAGSVLDAGSANDSPTARQDLGDGQADVAWTRGTVAPYEVLHQRFAVSRPFVRDVVANPSRFVAASGESTTISYSLADDPPGNVRVTARVYGGTGSLVRTLLNGVSQPVGNQSVVWDGKDDGGVIQPSASYSVRVSAVDATGLSSDEVRGQVSILRAVSASYGYDRLSRLTSASGGTGASSAYTYDPVGNRGSLARGGTSTLYAYDRADRITTAGSIPYSLNANGNLTARGSDSFLYDQANRLVSATVGSTTSSYAFDGDGLRVASTTGGVTTPAVYDVTAGLPVLLDDGSRKYVWGVTGLAYTVSGSPGAETTEVTHADGLGSVRALTDSTGTVVQTYGTDEFGVPDATLTQGSATQPMQYTGEPRDSTGLVYLRARMYDPSSGRFVQRDPFPGSVGVPLSLNRYSYVANNPVNLTDPSGLKSRALIGSFPALSAESRTSASLLMGPGCMQLPRPAAIACELLSNPAAARAAGKAGEVAAGIQKNTERIASATRSASYRIPDELIRNAARAVERISEVKNVAYLAYTKQVQDFVIFAASQGVKLELIVRDGVRTRLSAPLQELADAGVIIVRRSLEK